LGSKSSPSIRAEAVVAFEARSEAVSELLDLDKVERRIGDMDMDVRPLIAELRKLRESNEKLLDLNFGFMEQNRKLREKNARLREAVESAYCAVKPDGCDCGTDEPGSCALCLIEALREKGWVA